MSIQLNPYLNFDGTADTPLFTGTGAAGASLCGGSDVNGDSTADFAAGAPGEAGTGTNSGRAHVFFGSSPTINLGADIVVSGETPSETLGLQCSL